jgi:putative addiction module CopG family antidote
MLVRRQPQERLDPGANSWQLVSMAHALALENEQFIERMIRQGRFNNQSEVVREALRRMEREENKYLNPPPLTSDEARECFAPNPGEDAREHAFVKAAGQSRRRRLRRSPCTFEDL